MKTRDLILAIIIVTIWGVNFTVIKLGLGGVPPILLVALRYTLAALPAIFFIKKPQTSWKMIAAYGTTVGIGQFSCLFCAIKMGMPAGVSSVVLQAQAFFTIVFAAILFKEKIKTSQVVGLCVAASGLVFISGAIGSPQTIQVPFGALLLTLLAAVFWGLSNIIARKASEEALEEGRKLNMLSLVVWSSLIPPLPMLAGSMIVDKPVQIWLTLTNLSAVSIFSTLYLSLLSTVLAYGRWGTLLAKYPAGKVAPLSLLVPVAGLITARLVLKEELMMMQWVGVGVIILGLLLSNYASRMISHQ